MMTFEELKTWWTIKANEKACKQGKHRWAMVTDKREDDTVIFKVCQSCGVEERPS